MSSTRQKELDELYSLRDQLNEKSNDYTLRGLRLYDTVGSLKDAKTKTQLAERQKAEADLENINRQLAESKVEDQIKEVNRKIADLELELYHKILTSPRIRNSQ